MSVPKFLTAAFVALFLLHPALAEEANVASIQRLENSVKYLASDELEGRGPETKGIDLAADFIAGEFKKFGLKTDLFDGGPFQKFSFNLSVGMGPVESNQLSFVKPGGEPQQLKFDADFMSLAAGSSGKFDAPLVFAGYGITTDEKDWSYDDYAGLDVKGKVVILLRKEPRQQDEKSPFDGKKNSTYSYFNTKIANAEEHGAAAVLFVNDALEPVNQRKKLQDELNEAADDLSKERETFAKTESPKAVDIDKHLSNVSDLAETIARVSKELRGSQDKVLHFREAGDEGPTRALPVLFCTRAVVDKLLAAADKESLEELEKQIDSDLKPRSFALDGWKAAGQAALNVKRADTKNVVAVLEGEGPHADETIVIGAHYDHLGRGGYGSLDPGTHEIHNGADDNASGTAALLELAYRLSTNREKPSRRIVFIAFSGEERGLLGSAYYTRHPRFALEKTVAMINFDMVGRLTDNKLIVYGTGTAPEFDPLVEQLAGKMNFKLTKHEGGFGPSDHSSFYAKKIPVLHVFTGTHKQYHRPSDDTQLIEFDGMRRVCDFAEEIVRQTAKADGRPKYVEIKKFEHPDVIAASDTPKVDPNKMPYFGSVPDYSNEDPGVLLSGVQPDGPADKAGLKAGDLIVKFGGAKVSNIEDYMTAMMKYKPGDKVKVGIKRGKEELELEATLSKRPAPKEEPKKP